MSASRAAACPFWQAKCAHVTSSAALMQASEPASARHLWRNCASQQIEASGWKGGGARCTWTRWRVGELEESGSWAVCRLDRRGLKSHLITSACPAHDARCIAVLPSLSFSSGSGACKSPFDCVRKAVLDMVMKSGKKTSDVEWARQRFNIDFASALTLPSGIASIR